MYISRYTEKTVRDLSKLFGAVLVVGLRQVGKTTKLKQLTSDIGYVTLDDPIYR